jgi:membrane associated rhomboid family serine protease
MFPIRDINPTRTTPFVNYLLIVGNVAAFAFMKSLPPWYEPAYGLVPTRIVADPGGEVITVFTSMFMHANLLHLGGNLWFLWIFGDNVEDALGHTRYLLFYAMGGIAAALAQIFMNVASPIPMVGASGAIAAVTGGYVLLYPRAPILIVNPVPFLWLVMGLTLVVPAWLVAGEFFFMNLFTGIQSLHAEAASGEATGGVAFFAHLGGFVAGLLFVRPMRSGRARPTRSNWDGWRAPPRARMR